MYQNTHILQTLITILYTDIILVLVVIYNQKMFLENIYPNKIFMNKK